MEYADEYNNSSVLQRQEAIEVIEEFSDEIATMHGKCIDIGCGPGTVTTDLLLPKLPPDTLIVGADISKAMVDYGRKKYNGVKRLSFIELDIQTEELPTEEIGQYDNVVSFFCFHWCHNMRQTYGNIYKLLRPGGKCLILFLSYNNGFYAYTKMAENSRYTPHMQDASKYVSPFQDCPNPRVALKKILEDTGFEVLHCSNRGRSFIYKNLEDLRNHWTPVNPFYKRIPDHLKREYQEELMRELTERKIVFEHKNSKEMPKELKVLDLYRVLVAYFKKPEK